MSAERNAEICRLYKAGSSLQTIGNQLKISRERVRQILRQNQVYRKDRPLAKSDRDEFLGVNLSEADKEGLRAEAERRGLSMSSLTSDLIKEMLASVVNPATVENT